jgi:hypothetical protein
MALTIPIYIYILKNSYIIDIFFIPEIGGERALVVGFFWPLHLRLNRAVYWQNRAIQRPNHFDRWIYGVVEPYFQKNLSYLTGSIVRWFI